eukprot:364216-Chlamydomonas_euryale.AAC.6
MRPSRQCPVGPALDRQKAKLGKRAPPSTRQGCQHCTDVRAHGRLLAPARRRQVCMGLARAVA